ncbi:MAG TPA: hypothetical protein DEA05_11840, partial [Rhodobacteraceae bacterium]|nr:hypothetical protein [Paracoccaceae bacterium]
DDIGLGGAGEDTVFMLQGESTDPARVTDYTAAEDALIYVYEGAEEPEIEITDNGDGTYDILADGAVLAVVRSDATLTADMITLYSTGSDAADSAA